MSFVCVLFRAISPSSPHCVLVPTIQSLFPAFPGRRRTRQPFAAFSEAVAQWGTYILSDPRFSFSGGLQYCLSSGILHTFSFLSSDSPRCFACLSSHDRRRAMNPGCGTLIRLEGVGVARFPHGGQLRGTPALQDPWLLRFPRYSAPHGPPPPSLKDPILRFADSPVSEPPYLRSLQPPHSQNLQSPPGGEGVRDLPASESSGSTMRLAAPGRQTAPVFSGPKVSRNSWRPERPNFPTQLRLSPRPRLLHLSNFR